MTQWGKYILREKIAQGGMAEIFAADCLAADGVSMQRVCIKRIRPEYSDNPEFRQMFEREARIARAIRHPNVVNVFDFDTHQDHCFIAMELIDGWDLKKILNSAFEIGATLPVGFAFHVFAHILEALCAAASVWVDGKLQAVIHRDISPHNILISRKGEARLTDFGIAKSRDGSMMTRTGVIKGKLAYLAPEQVDSGDISPRTDQFCLGLVLYEMLAGRRFNQGKGEGEVLALAMNPPVPNIPWLSAEINGFLRTLLAPVAAQRFPSPEEAKVALRRLSLPVYSAADAALFLHGVITSEIKNTVESIDREAVLRAAQTTIGGVLPGTVESPAALPRRRLSIARTNIHFLWGTVIALTIAGLLVGGMLVNQSTLQTDTDAIRLADADSPEQRTNDSGAAETHSIHRRDATGSRGDIVMRVSGSGAPAGATSVDRTAVGDSAANTAEAMEGGAHAPAMKPATSNAPVATPGGSAPSAVGVRGASHEATARGTGSLQVLCRPWAYVSVDGKDFGTTPLAGHTLPVGRHTIVLENRELNFRKKMSVFVRRDKLTKINERIVTLTSGDLSR
ncbi:MAG: serine/threonine protein kinase [Deltaproteobacteria bacterium]|nr:serine/threonine protein kinase [Deltaproteobacteria bacterium]